MQSNYSIKGVFSVKTVPRHQIYGLYWYYAYERFMMLKRRLEGDQPPYTADPILKHFKFCNTMRFTDRVSQDLITRIVCAPTSPENDIFRTVLCRFFSKPSTFEHIEQSLGHNLQINDLKNESLIDILNKYSASGEVLYTNAFILCASPYFGRNKKHQNHIELFRLMFLQDSFASKVLALKTMKQLTDLLQTYPMIGPFMAYQIANDLCYLDHVDINPNTHTIAGPGALRGIAKAFESRGSLTPAEIIMQMYQNQDAEFAARGYDFKVQSGRRLELIDCQGLFCELDKYCRVAHPELASSRVRIKNTHKQSPLPVTYITPPKWS